MFIKTLCKNFWKQNSYVIEWNSKIFVIDPGLNLEVILEFLTRNNINKIEAILLTHYHFDHVAAVDKLAKKFKCFAYIHEKELPFLLRDTLSKAFFRKEIKVSKKYIKTFTTKLIWKNIDIQICATHSPASTIFIFDKNIFSGDLIFLNTIGRLDLPGSNKQNVVKLISIFKNFSDDFKVFPGHYKSFTVRELKKENPYINDNSFNR